MKFGAGLAWVAAAAMLQGCVAAAVPIVAAGAMGARTAFGGKRAEAGSPSSRAPIETATATERGMTLLPPGSVLPPPSGVIAPVDDVKPSPAATDPWRAMVRHVAGRSVERPTDSVVMVAGSSIATPRWVACGDKPLAAIVDVELSGTPEAAASLEALRTMGVGVVTMAGRPIPGAQRTILAAKYCVVAILGDQPADFSDQLRNAGADWTTVSAPAAGLKDAGWFLATTPIRTSAKITEGTPD